MEGKGSLGAEEGHLGPSNHIRSIWPPEAAGGREPTKYESMKEKEEQGDLQDDALKRQRKILSQMVPDGAWSAKDPTCLDWVR